MIVKDYYFLDASKNVEEYISISDGIKEIEKPCQLSEFQFLDKKPIHIEADEDSGRIFQDFMYDKGVPVISDRMKDCLDSLFVDYLFFKKILITKKKLGMEEVYWLALPPRINCLNREESEIDEMLNVAEKIVINEGKVGRYEIFKLGGVGNLDIIISDNVANVLKEKKFVGVHIYKIS